MIFELMRLDTAQSVYLGRPCYHLNNLPDHCDSSLWTAQRYSMAVVNVLAEAVTGILERQRPSSVVLIGHSGGGTLATLVGEALPPAIPITVITLAANLDIAAWTDFHGHLPLEGSLNPAQLPATRKRVHYHGKEDQVVPLTTLESYRERHPQTSFVLLDSCGHSDCWKSLWPELLTRATNAN